MHITQVTDDSETEQNVFSCFEIGQRVTAVVTAVFTGDDDGEHKMAELSLRPSAIKAGKAEVLSFASLKDGQAVKGVVEKVEDGVIWVFLANGVRGRILVIDAASSLKAAGALDTKYAPGCPITCSVIAVDSGKKRLDLGLGDAVGTIEAGESYLGRISKVSPGEAMYVQLPNGKYGRLAITEIGDSFTTDPMKDFEAGKLVDCRVLRVDDKQKYIDVSLRSAGATAEALDLRDVVDVAQLEVGATAKGYVRSMSSVGCFVNISRSIVARVIMRELSNDFVNDPETQFPRGMLVRAPTRPGTVGPC